MIYETRVPAKKHQERLGARAAGDIGGGPGRAPAAERAVDRLRGRGCPRGGGPDGGGPDGDRDARELCERRVERIGQHTTGRRENPSFAKDAPPPRRPER